MTEWLLSHGADINALDRFKRTPLEVLRSRPLPPPKPPPLNPPHHC